MTKGILLILIAVISALLCRGHALAIGDQYVKAGDHNLFMRVMGEGELTVVLDAGIGDGASQIQPLQERLAEHFTVIAYDRAGYGLSEPGAFPRNAETEAADLHAMLQEVGASGPFLFVGHSLGGMNLQVYADMYPGNVAALVLLDPPPLPFVLGEAFPELQAMAHDATAEWESMASQTDTPDFFHTIASEHREMFDSSAKSVASIDTFGDVPLFVLASVTPNPAFGDAADEYQKLWIDENRKLAKKSTNGRFLRAENAGHYIWRDDVDFVVEAVLEAAKMIQDKQ